MYIGWSTKLYIFAAIFGILIVSSHAYVHIAIIEVGMYNIIDYQSLDYSLLPWACMGSQFYTATMVFVYYLYKC